MRPRRNYEAGAPILTHVIAGLDPAIQGNEHRICRSWMPGSRPGMTVIIFGRAERSGGLVLVLVFLVLARAERLVLERLLVVAKIGRIVGVGQGESWRQV